MMKFYWKPPIEATDEVALILKEMMERLEGVS